MVAAFRDPVEEDATLYAETQAKIQQMMNTPIIENEESEDEERIDEDVWRWESQRSQQSQDDLNDGDDCEELAMATVITTIVKESLRNPCLAHLLHLAVKDTLTISKLSTKIYTKINNIITFFRTRNHYYSLLKNKTGKLGLIRPCVTRWNSFYYALKRIISPTRENVMQN